jgi:type IV pilus assembly protein PilY1
VWEAGNQLHQRDADDRTIYTGLGSNLMTFDSGQAGVLQAPLGALDLAEASNIIDWTRGEEVTGLRDRSGWKLGDIIHSTPVVVGPPSNFDEDPGYQSFMDAHASRTKMVYVGSNDGMLHAFHAETGHEAWAFVPEFALPDLATVADTSYCHQYTVDLTPTVRDCQLNGAWRTVLIGGGREGGSGYFALDVTDPHSPDLLWQVSLPNGKPFASQVEFAVVGGETVALIGSGLDESNGEAMVEVYAVDDGTHLGTAPLAVDAGRRNKATAPRAVDLDLDGEHDALYVADLQGHVWKFVFNGSSDPWSWDRYCLWEDTSKEISSPPTPAYGDGGSVNVYFGTGAYLEESDIATREDNIFGCIIDRQSGMQYASLHDQTDGIDDLTGADGWYLRLENQSGERVTEPAVVVAESVFFTSFVPSQEVCSAGGNSWLYRLDYRDASVPDDGESDDWDGNRSVDLDQGVASRPVVDVVNETVIVQSSDATITVQEIGQSYFHLRVRSWQESFDYVSAQPDSN